MKWRSSLLYLLLLLLLGGYYYYFEVVQTRQKEMAAMEAKKDISLSDRQGECLNDCIQGKRGDRAEKGGRLENR